MRLEEYLRINNISKTDFARSIGMSIAHITNICNGWKNPSIKVIRKIIEATDGQVNVADLFNPEVPRKQTK